MSLVFVDLEKSINAVVGRYKKINKDINKIILTPKMDSIIFFDFKTSD